MLPSLERLRQLVVACGLELTVGLANADPSEHDLALIRRALRLSPLERLAASERDADELCGLWSRGG